ncbi:MAG: respiratory nitrate reductase subunit gamma [Longimicrobiales bacterium]
MSGPVLFAVAYGLLAVFVIAFIVRTVGLSRLPVHLRWELAPVPKEKGRGRYGGSYLEEYEWWKKPREESLANELAYMGREILLLKALWEHNRALWWFSFPFHWGLYLLIGAAGVALLAALLGLAGIGGAGFLTGLIAILAVAGYALGLVGALGLLARRLTVQTMRAMTTRVAYLNLILLGAVFGTGLWAALTVAGYGQEILRLGGGLLTADATMAVATPLAVHLVVTGLFLAYLPFSQMMHFVAKYFTYHEVRWDDEPLEVGGELEREVLKLMQQPVTWAGPHVNADGKKNWVDIATEEAGR